MKKIDLSHIIKSAIPDNEYEERLKKQEEKEEKARIKNIIYKTEEGINAPEHFTLQNYTGKRPEVFNPQKTIFIGGPPNTGKTHLGCAISRVYAAAGIGPVLRIKENEFALECKYANARELRELIMPAKKAKILFWDDLHRAHDFAVPEVKGAMMAIFEYRAERKLRNIFTCKYTMLVITNFYGDDFVRRILQKEKDEINHEIITTEK